MKTRKKVWIILLSAILVLPLMLIMFNSNGGKETTVPVQEAQTVPEADTDKVQELGQDSEQESSEEDAGQEQPEILWGLDTASPVDTAFIQCVAENYGKPAFFGRYLETKEGVSAGLTADEAAFLHNQGIKIIPIFNHFTDATTYEQGIAEAEEAIAYAENLGIPQGIAIFADIEPGYPVDEAFIRGWVDTLLDSPYHPGIYGVFRSDRDVTAAYQAAAANSQTVADETIIWSSNPEPGITAQADAPAFEPGAPENINVSIWQYGIDGQTCNIDTNLIKSDILDSLW
ncbi:glycoside hydrolase domain-containing protein [Bacillus sp. MRMR6]|uniref:glycoside hydrolase domain-containing protein n=1 Tax=Bacillus sp. MRMR6 TaxID=1928617 RepID=UPI0009533E7F|nr:glycoside hydrolase domain-containing protein [Bacillus sp. MRMR6]OLS33985.1 hypothetical protein BTR25_23580 [Bacillus sp. MRMR6]